ncbi:MAG: hypothetical protein N3B11_06890 [Coriobacteriia bacterium]|nr:hypothetical protein [Coriobacteriia bacterium]
MSSARGNRLLHEAAVRIVVRYLKTTGCTDVAVCADAMSEAQGIDIVYRRDGRQASAKVKADAYAGDDVAKIARRDLSFYRAATDLYGIEALADTLTRQPGWIQRSQADELLYYRLAIAQTEEEVAALMDEPDDVFFSEIAVERDDLRVIPMRALQSWFASAGERYAPRPVLTDGRPSWHRLVPESDLESAVPGVQRIGSIFARVRG